MANPKRDPSDLSSLLGIRKQHKSQDTENNRAAANRSPVDKVEDSKTSDTKEKKKPGRPPGRRSDPNCSPLNLLINEDTVNEAKYKLAKQNKGKTPKKSLSDLVEELLDRWIEDN